jgi:hypothetical protein
MAVALVAATRLRRPPVAQRRQALRALGGSDEGLELALGPGALMATYGLASWALPLARRVEWFLGGDHVRHLVFVGDLNSTGYLGYGPETYPHAWHTLMAMELSVGGVTQGPDGLESLITMMATSTWLLLPR